MFWYDQVFNTRFLREIRRDCFTPCPDAGWRNLLDEAAHETGIEFITLSGRWMEELFPSFVPVPKSRKF